MSTPHRSTPEHWATVESYAQQVSSTDDCLLELRARVEALEAGATCPHVETSDEGTSYCRLAEQASPTGKESLTVDSSLVERVGDALADEYQPSGTWHDEARAAIREVATWLDTRGLSSGISAARWLLEEVER